jgi:hypothetical protein
MRKTLLLARDGIDQERDGQVRWNVGTEPDATNDGRKPLIHSAADRKYVRDVLAKELDHRRDRRTQIFSWASSLLVGIIGGTIALTKSDKTALSLPDRLVLSTVVSILTADALVWITYHWGVETRTQREIGRYNTDLDIPEVSKPHRLDWPNFVAVALLALAALGALWLPTWFPNLR